MNNKTIAIAVAFTLAATGQAMAKPPKFKADCPTDIKVRVNDKGRVRINGENATVKEFSPTAWEASHGGVTVNFGVEGDSLSVVYTLKGGANGICEVTAYSASASGPALPEADEKACLQAVKRQTNNDETVLLETSTSEANNTAIIGVGPQKARWQCLVKNGEVAEVMSLTNEGTQ